MNAFLTLRRFVDVALDIEADVAKAVPETSPPAVGIQQSMVDFSLLVVTSEFFNVCLSFSFGFNCVPWSAPATDANSDLAETPATCGSHPR
jgi:hypothetical protein